MSAFATKLARLASAEGEEDVDILRHHRATVLLAEAAATLRAGSSASHRAQAAEKMAIALSGSGIVECHDFALEFVRAYKIFSSFAADAADVGPAAMALVPYLDAISLMRVYGEHGGDIRLECAAQIMALLE